MTLINQQTFWVNIVTICGDEYGYIAHVNQAGNHIRLLTSWNKFLALVHSTLKPFSARQWIIVLPFISDTMEPLKIKIKIEYIL